MCVGHRLEEAKNARAKRRQRQDVDARLRRHRARQARASGTAGRASESVGRSLCRLCRVALPAGPVTAPRCRVRPQAPLRCARMQPYPPFDRPPVANLPARRDSTSSRWRAVTTRRLPPRLTSSVSRLARMSIKRAPNALARGFAARMALQRRSVPQAGAARTLRSPCDLCLSSRLCHESHPWLSGSPASEAAFRTDLQQPCITILESPSTATMWRPLSWAGCRRSCRARARYAGPERPRR